MRTASFLAKDCVAGTKYACTWWPVLVTLPGQRGKQWELLRPIKKRPSNASAGGKPVWIQHNEHSTSQGQCTARVGSCKAETRWIAWWLRCSHSVRLPQTLCMHAWVSCDHMDHGWPCRAMNAGNTKRRTLQMMFRPPRLPIIRPSLGCQFCICPGRGWGGTGWHLSPNLARARDCIAE